MIGFKVFQLFEVANGVVFVALDAALFPEAVVENDFNHYYCVLSCDKLKVYYIGGS